MKICRGRNRQLVVSCQVMTTPCCGFMLRFHAAVSCCGFMLRFHAAVSCCGFISHLIGRETINIPEIVSGVHGFTGKTVNI